MKSKLIYIILLLSFSTSIMAQPVTTLPYYCSFEENVENAQWTFSARPSAAPNRWITGTAISRSGVYSMYVSSDAGVSANYIDDGSTGYCIVASREFALPMGLYDLSFNWKAAGDQGVSMHADELNQNTTKDEFRVAWVPISVYNGLAAGGSSSANDFPNYALTYPALFSGRDVFSGVGAWQTALGLLNVSSNENYRLMFIWKIDGDARKTDPAACIDNIQIAKRATSTDCWKAPIFTIDTVAGGINISWNAIAGAASYDLIYFTEGSITMDTITGITGASYFIPYSMLPNGRYCFLMRTICPDGTMGIWSEKPSVKVVDWDNIQLVPQACPELSFDVSEIDQSTGLGIIHPDCKGNEYTIHPTIGATSGRIAGYSVIPISYDPPYPIGPAPGANLIFSSNAPDDSWGQVISLPFAFCFFENTYSKAIVGANGQITFDTSHPAYAGGTNPYDFTANDNIPNTGFLPQGQKVFNSIFGVYEDIDPSKAWGTAGVYAGVLGAKPCRTLCVSFKDIPCYGNNQFTNSYQMVLYEGSNVIEVYVDRRNNKSITNQGKGIIGVINEDGSDGIAAPGRNVNDPAWQVLNDDQREAWRFVPIQSSTYEMAWYKGAGVSGAKLGKDTILTVFEGDGNDTITVRMQFNACNGEHFDLRDTAIIIWNPLDSVFVDEVVCYGETCVNPYFQETQAGTYSKLLTSAAGCDSAYYTLNLKVHKSVTYSKQ
ncbi:MAG: hypothetical protein LBV75_09795, partial [Paludibacter sp.]|nr:hypothetical protein [Paludibacter sp.]